MIHLLDTAGLHRDPRTRMQQEQQERKISGPKQPDGSKLSFAEKMKLFAQEVVNKNSTFCWADNDPAFYSRPARQLRGTKRKFRKLREKLIQLTNEQIIVKNESIPVQHLFSDYLIIFCNNCT